jgi:hypothetical protein
MILPPLVFPASTHHPKIEGSNTAGVNFTNILLAAFVQKSFRQKITTQIVST